MAGRTLYLGVVRGYPRDPRRTIQGDILKVKKENYNLFFGVFCTFLLVFMTLIDVKLSGGPDWVFFGFFTVLIIYGGWVS